MCVMYYTLHINILTAEGYESVLPNLTLKLPVLL